MNYVLKEKKNGNLLWLRVELDINNNKVEVLKRITAFI